MTPSGRQEQIVEILRLRGKTAVLKLAEQLEASPETIRRDLNALAKAGKVQKTHGGAMMPQKFGEGPFQQRMLENAAAKAAIGRRAAGLFSAGQTLFVDTGSTTLYFAESLAQVAGVTVVTNSTEVVTVMGSSGEVNQVYMLGGTYRSGNLQTVGSIALNQIAGFHAHHTVLTVGGLNAKGMMDFDLEETQIAKAMIARSESITLLVDHSKFDRIASFEVCPMAKIDRVICDESPRGTLAEALEKNGVDVIVA